MAQSLSRKSAPPKKSVRSDVPTKGAKTINKKVLELTKDFKTADIINLLKDLNVGKKWFTCYLCGEVKGEKDFYKNSDPRSITETSRVCKHCIDKIVYEIDDYGERQEPTKQSIMTALEYLDRPFVEVLYDSAVAESLTTKQNRGHFIDEWGCYIKSVNSLSQYQTMRWRDSDSFKRTYKAMELNRPQDIIDSDDGGDHAQDIEAGYEVNKRDVIRFVGYDPFKEYPRDSDKPRLYAQLVNFLDEETKNDGMKLAAVIQIVKKLNQAEKLNDQIDAYTNDIKHAAENQPIINKMADSQSKMMTIVNNLAKDNGISVNHNNQKSKGANTLSGKMKKLKEIGLREAEINTFDLGSCRGMQQVAELSEAARHKQIGYDENIAQEIKDIKVELVEMLTKERDIAQEEARKLLVENKDLKEFMIEHNIMSEHGEVLI